MGWDESGRMPAAVHPASSLMWRGAARRSAIADASELGFVAALATLKLHRM